MTLFKRGDFQLHSGARSPWKIDCDALTPDDLQTIAALIAERLTFGSVIGVPRGGLRLAAALASYATNGPLLIVDDVLTTGGSMEEIRAGREAIGAVIFARHKPPSWVWALFQFNEREKGQKTCKGCGETKPIDQFQADVVMRDGHHNYCRKCQNARLREKRGTLKPSSPS